MMLFREGAIKVQAGEKRIDDPENLGDSVEKLWFRVLFDAVAFWYVERYGAPAMEPKGNAVLKGAQIDPRLAIRHHHPCKQDSDGRGRRTRLDVFRSWSR